MKPQTAAQVQDAPRFPREIAPRTFWFAGCNESRVGDKILHTHNSCFLLIGDSATVLIDTAMAHVWGEMRHQLTEALDGRPLDYIFPTHPELPHIGNLGPLLDTYPEARLIGDLRNYHLMFPDQTSRFLPMSAGETLDLGGRQLKLLPAIVRDLPNTLWGYEAEMQILFVSDGWPFSHDHRLGECAMMTDELAAMPEPGATANVLGGALGWTRFVDAELTIGDIEEFVRDHPARIIAPAHACVIVDPDSLTEIFKAGIRGIRNK
jgi:hypothetical protein